MAQAGAGPGHPAGAVAAILEDALDSSRARGAVRPGSNRPSALAGRPGGGALSAGIPSVRTMACSNER